MPVKIRYTPKGTPYEDWSNATASEELELYRQLAPKEGFVNYTRQPRSRHTAPTADLAAGATNPAAA